MGNYVECDNNEEVNKMFHFTNWRYWQDGSMYSQNKNTLLSSCLSFQSFYSTKKCFICRRIGCWSTNHVQYLKNSLVIVTPSIKIDQVMNQIYTTR